MEQNEMQSTMNALADVVNNFAVAMRPTLERISVAIRPLYDAIRAQYVAEGAIYGDTHEGMMRWMDERGERT